MTRYSVKTRNWELATFFLFTMFWKKENSTFLMPIVVCVISDGRALIQHDKRLNCPAHRDQAAG